MVIRSEKVQSSTISSTNFDRSIYMLTSCSRKKVVQKSQQRLFYASRQKKLTGYSVASQYHALAVNRGCIQRDTWCMGPYAGGADYNLTLSHSPLSSAFHPNGNECFPNYLKRAQSTGKEGVRRTGEGRGGSQLYVILWSHGS